MGLYLSSPAFPSCFHAYPPLLYIALLSNAFLKPFS